MAAGPAGPYLLPGRASVISGAYPLSRSAYAFVDRPPGRLLAPSISALLDYILSAQGQTDVARADGYLPLDPGAAAQGRKSLCTGDSQCD